MLPKQGEALDAVLQKVWPYSYLNRRLRLLNVERHWSDDSLALLAVYTSSKSLVHTGITRAIEERIEAISS
jgi:hypothetical protein